MGERWPGQVVHLERALAAAAPVALFDHPELQRNTRKMLSALDRFWQADEGRSPRGWDRLWWETYERYRARVEAALNDPASVSRPEKCPTCGDPVSEPFKNSERECSDACHEPATNARLGYESLSPPTTKEERP